MSRYGVTVQNGVFSTYSQLYVTRVRCSAVRCGASYQQLHAGSQRATRAEP